MVPKPGLEFHLKNHFRVLKNFADFFLKSFIDDGFDAGDGSTGVICFVFQLINNTGHPGKTDTTSTATGTVQHGTTDIIEDALFLQPDNPFF